MKHPEFTKYGLPTEETLYTIRAWEYTDNVALMKFVLEAWRDARATAWESLNNTLYTFATKRWEGNEALIDALRRNTLFWESNWFSSTREGVYIFNLDFREN